MSGLGRQQYRKNNMGKMWIRLKGWMSVFDFSVPLLSTFLTCHPLRLYKIRYFTSGHSLHLDSILTSVWYTFSPPHKGICSYSTFTHMNSDSEIFRFAPKQLNYDKHLFKVKYTVNWQNTNRIQTSRLYVLQLMMELKVGDTLPLPSWLKKCLHRIIFLLRDQHPKFQVQLSRTNPLFSSFLNGSRLVLLFPILQVWRTTWKPGQCTWKVMGAPCKRELVWVSLSALCRCSRLLVTRARQY